MERRKPATTEQRAVATLTRRMGGAVLSQDDLDDLDEDRPGVERPDGEMNTEKILADLLAACGIHIPANLDEAEFKRKLCEACMKKVRELTSKGGGTQAKGNPNPLISGHAGGDIAPTYLSITDQLREENERLWMERQNVALAVAMAPSPTLSPQRIEEIASMMANRMGAPPEPSGVSLSTTNEDELADLLVSKMSGASGRY